MKHPKDDDDDLRVVAQTSLGRSYKPVPAREAVALEKGFWFSASVSDAYVGDYLAIKVHLAGQRAASSGEAERVWISIDEAIAMADCLMQAVAEARDKRRK